MKQYKFIISGGGTGGHIYPAISIADRLLEVFPKSDITFVGSIGRMEMKTIPKYLVHGITVLLTVFPSLMAKKGKIMLLNFCQILLTKSARI